jgi:nucleoside-diphosphate-sugar epimerase
MRIAVFGGGGFLGLPLCSALHLERHEIIVADRFYFGFRPHGIEYWFGDTRTVTANTLSGFEAVVDLAGLSNDASCDIDPTYTKSINEEGGKNLFKCSQEAGVRRYIYASSASVYGAGKKENLNETDPVNPLTAYANSKLAVEHFIRARKNYSEPVILRFATLFGISRRMRFDLAINAMVGSAWRHRSVTVHGDGSQIRPFLHVKDAVGAIIWALEAPAKAVSGEIFNVGSEENQMSIREAAVVVQNRCNGTIIRDMINGQDARSYHLCFDKYNKARGDFGVRMVGEGVDEITAALKDGDVDLDDPTTMTMPYYRSMLEWDKRLGQVRMDGKVM